MEELIWTEKPPEDEGFYWKRYVPTGRMNILDGPDIVYVRCYEKRLCVMNWPIPVSNKYRKVEWAGPIPFPRKLKRVIKD